MGGRGHWEEDGGAGAEAGLQEGSREVRHFTSSSLEKLLGSQIAPHGALSLLARGSGSPRVWQVSGDLGRGKAFVIVPLLLPANRCGALAAWKTRC